MPRRRSGRGVAGPRHGDGGSPGELPDGRFGKLFPDAATCTASRPALERLAAVLERRKVPSAQIHDIPSGFTYLGQFIDHDITFDPVSELARPGDPGLLVNFRTPRFDLDSVYGLGPAVQPFLYDWDRDPAGARLLVEWNPDGTADLPRNHQARALAGDPRNDENVIVAQLHLLFLRFHNAVVDLLRPGAADAATLLDDARQTVRWHFQWIVVHEFLARVVGKTLARTVLVEPPGAPARAALEHYAPAGVPFIPVEFSGAAYRFGHSMVRDAYFLQRGAPLAVPIFPDLAGGKRLTRNLAIDWERFFVLDPGDDQTQLSFGINTMIAQPLFRLPEPDHNLPLRNLLRGITLELPSGQAVADALGLPGLTVAELRLEELLGEPAHDQLAESTPLWYYVLCEAEKAGARRLGPVGGRIVAEVLVGLLAADPRSYLSVEPSWRPTLGSTKPGEPADFTMADLIGIARRGA